MSEQNEQLIVYGECNYIPVRKMGYHDINPWHAGFQKCSPGYITPHHIREHYLFHYITAGEGSFCIDSKTYHLKKGQMFLIQPGRHVTYCASKKNPWSYIWVGFDGEIAKKLDNISENVFNIDGDVFHRIKNCSSYSDMREIYLISCILEIFCQIMDNPKKLDIISTVKGYINENSIPNISVSVLAENLDLNPTYLSTLFKKHTGISLSAYILKRKMEIAKGYLQNDFDLKTTANLLGYSDVSTFSRAYKKHFGYPPSQDK